MKLTEAQMEFFKDSKVRDEDGNLLRMYHGTSNGGFTVFEYGKSHFGLFGEGFYFTADPEEALSYTEKGNGRNPEVYEYYLNITNPIDMDAEGNPNLQVSISDFTDWSMDMVEDYELNHNQEECNFFLFRARLPLC